MIQDPEVLCSDGATESQRLEFKRSLPGRSDRDRHEFLKDVCAFANTEGGVIYFGIDEKDGAAESLSPTTDEPFEAASRRLAQILDSGVEPRLASVRFKQFSKAGGHVLALEVSRSFNGPHRLLHNNHSKFVLRNNTHVVEHTFDQLRSAFDQRGSLVSQARTVWEEGWRKAASRQTWRPIVPGPIAMAQITPLASIRAPQPVDIQKIYADYARFMLSDWGGASRAFNLDGVVVHRGDDRTEISQLVQVHRSGVMQAYRSAAAHFDEKIIPSQSIAEFFREVIPTFAKAAIDYGVGGPFVLNCALLDTTDYRFAIDDRYFFLSPSYSDRANLILPEVIFDDPEQAKSEPFIRSVLDILWQGFGLPTCTYYNSEGQWIAR